MSSEKQHRKWREREGVRTLLLLFTMILASHVLRLQVEAHGSAVVRYPIGERLVQNVPKFDPSGNAPKFNDQLFHHCLFNTECICSNTGPDLGLVVCDKVELGRIPVYLNNTKIHTLTLSDNKLAFVDDYSFYGTGMHRLEVRHNRLHAVGEKALWGLERSIWELAFPNNLLTTIPTKSIGKLRKLSLLDLTGNQISNINSNDFDGIGVSLKTLLLGGNSIATIHSSVFKDLKSIREIVLRDNNIHYMSDLAFKDTPGSLIHVNLANNALLSIPFESLSEVRNLQTLDLSRNKISQTFDVLFNGFLAMDTLILDMNDVRSLPPYSFQNFGNVNRTSLRGNPLTEIENDAFRDAKIRELYLHDCQLSFLSETAFRGLETNLKVLDLGYNNLSSLPKKVFENLDSVRFLSIGHNDLSIDPKTAFNGFKYTLQHLNLLGNKMGKFSLDSMTEIRNVRTLGLSSLPDSTLSKEDFQGFGPAVEKLYLLNNEIKSIHSLAFEHVPGIKLLDLSFNSINEIEDEAFVNIGGGLEKLKINSGLTLTKLPFKPMHYLSHLRELDLSNNKISEIEDDCFRYMINLRKLNLQDNKMKKIDKYNFKGNNNPLLEYIKLSYNQIKNIDSHTFNDFENLHSIYLNDNIIDSINRFAFMNLKNIQYLFLQGNKIKTLSFESFQNLPKLKYLDLSFNEMDNLNLDAFEQVGTLSSLTIDASHNKINQLKLNGSAWNSYSGIKIINFNHNNISYIPPSFFESVRSSIIHILLQNNNLNNVSSATFENLPYLSLLNFANNVIEYIDSQAFKGSYSLQHLDLSNNRITELSLGLFDGQVNLRHVDISRNRIDRIPESLFSESSLEILKARHNEIRKFPIFSRQQSSENIRVIDLAFNHISELKIDSFSSFPNIVHLDLSHNHLKTIESKTFTNLRKLVFLDISHNFMLKLRKNMFDYVKDTLHTLHLSNISMTSVPEVNLPQLRTLNISSNKLSFIPTSSMGNLTNLRSLDVSQNNLGTVYSKEWHLLSRLQSLHLQGNPIRSIVNETFLGLQRLEDLNIQQLPLKVFEAGSLDGLVNLKSFAITTDPSTFNYNLAKRITNLPLLSSLALEAKGKLLSDQMRGWKLPSKLSNIFLTGNTLSSISDTAFQMLSSRELTLVLKRVNVKSVPRSFFKNLGATRFLALSIGNTSINDLGYPCTTDHPGEPNTVFLTDLLIEENDWKCDCGIGWTETWMKAWKSSICPEGPDTQCESTMRGMRSAKCGDKRQKKSLMLSLKTDLECGAKSKSISLTYFTPNIFAYCMFSVFFSTVWQKLNDRLVVSC